MKLLATIALAIASGSPAGASAVECLRFEPAEVTLVGTLITRTYPGPPNYTSIEEGDMPEIASILVLTEPICVAADPDDELNSERVSNVREIQLVIPGSSDTELSGKPVVVRGRLFSALTGHHHVRVLLSVSMLHAA